jgi:hypothetical protein
VSGWSLGGWRFNVDLSTSFLNAGSKGQDFTQPVRSATGVTINSGSGVIVAGISLCGLFATTSQDLADRE